MWNPGQECSWKFGGHAHWMMGKTGVLVRGRQLIRQFFLEVWLLERLRCSMSLVILHGGRMPKNLSAAPTYLLSLFPHVLYTHLTLNRGYLSLWFVWSDTGQTPRYSLSHHLTECPSAGSFLPQEVRRWFWVLSWSEMLAAWSRRTEGRAQWPTFYMSHFPSWIVNVL